MRLVLSIGPDILTTSRYKSKRGLQRYLTNKLSCQNVRDDSCTIFVFSRQYCKAEIRDANILTMNEFFKLHEET